MINKLKKQALDKWFNDINTDIQQESFKFQDSCIPFGAGLGMGVICKHFKELQDIVDDDGWIEIKTRPSTYDEKQRYQDIIWMYDCELPDDGQEVLVTTSSGDVEKTFYHAEHFVFEDYEGPDDLLAWRPLPEGFKRK